MRWPRAPQAGRDVRLHGRQQFVDDRLYMFDVIAGFIDNVRHLDSGSMLASAEHHHPTYFVYTDLWRNDVDQSVDELAG